LRLLADGQRNAEIANMLVLSSRTVERHSTGISGKLDRHGPAARAAAVTFAHAHGLSST
jgi:DNA-binding NarL/FixJ family response regulator